MLDVGLAQVPKILAVHGAAASATHLPEDRPNPGRRKHLPHVIAAAGLLLIVGIRDQLVQVRKGHGGPQHNTRMPWNEDVKFPVTSPPNMQKLDSMTI